MNLLTTPEQRAIITATARTKVLVAGRRWGKSVTAALHLVHTAFQYPGSCVWYIGQNYTRSLEVMRMMQTSPAFRQTIRHVYAQFPARFVLRNGSTIQFHSADKPQNLRGAGLSLFVLDEPASVRKSLYYEVLLPMLADSRAANRGGIAFVCGTYYGQDNWFYRLANPETPRPDWRQWTYPTSTGMRFLSARGQAELATYRAELPASVYEQEYECKPLVTRDQVFRFMDRCISGAEQPARSGARYVIGLDLGRVQDPSAYVVLDLGTGQVVRAGNYPLGQEHHETAMMVAQLSRQYHDALVVIDSTGGGSGGHADSHVRVYRERVQHVRECLWTRALKYNMVAELSLKIEQKKLAIPAGCEELIAQLSSYRYSFGAYGTIHYGAPTGGHDDQVAALMMAVWAWRQGWAGPQTGTYNF